MKQIFSSGDSVQVEMKRAVLESAGIRCVVHDPQGVTDRLACRAAVAQLGVHLKPDMMSWKHVFAV